MKKLSSLTIFFPFYNDAGTVEKQIHLAYTIGAEVADVLEVIAIRGGNSQDNTFEKIKQQKDKYPDLVIIDKKDNNEGYAVIKYGFQKATKDWVFYTDGDAQYDVLELKKLVAKQQQTMTDIVNGYKVNRKDNIARLLYGEFYRKLSTWLFQLPIRDTDCDFRLIRRALLKKISLESHDASILPELIKRLHLAGATFAEVPVSHSARKYGTSNYTVWSLMKEKIIGDLHILWKLYRKQMK